MICAEKHLHIGGRDCYGEPSKYKGSTEYQKVKQVMRAIEDNDEKWDENYDFDVWLQRYAPRITRVPEASSNSQDDKPLKEAEHGYVKGSREMETNFQLCQLWSCSAREDRSLLPRGRPTR